MTPIASAQFGFRSHRDPIAIDSSFRFNLPSKLPVGLVTIASVTPISSGRDPIMSRQLGSKAAFSKALNIEECEMLRVRPDFERIRRAYLDVLRINPVHVLARNNLGVADYHSKCLSRAQENFQKVVTLSPYYAIGFFNLANTFDGLSNSNQSIFCYRRAIQINPSYADAHYNLALALEDKHQFWQALEHWKTYCRLDIEMHEPWFTEACLRIRRIINNSITRIQPTSSTSASGQELTLPNIQSC
jgi:tetratricopeptide (TPR) repeat protein